MFLENRNINYFPTRSRWKKEVEIFIIQYIDFNNTREYNPNSKAYLSSRKIKCCLLVVVVFYIINILCIIIILIYLIHDAGYTHYFLKNLNFVDPGKGEGGTPDSAIDTCYYPHIRISRFWCLLTSSWDLLKLSPI